MTDVESLNDWFRKCETCTQTVVARTIASGATRFYLECDSCGSTVQIRNNDPRTRTAVPYRGIREQRWTEWSAVQEAKKQRDDREWWAKYEAHLASDVWKALRLRVFEREAGLCQGCRLASGTQVHHVTYKRLGRELLTDLVLFCDDCHAHHHETER